MPSLLPYHCFFMHKVRQWFFRLVVCFRTLALLHGPEFGPRCISLSVWPEIIELNARFLG